MHGVKRKRESDSEPANTKVQRVDCFDLSVTSHLHAERGVRHTTKSLFSAVGWPLLVECQFYTPTSTTVSLNAEADLIMIRYTGSNYVRSEPLYALLLSDVHNRQIPDDMPCYRAVYSPTSTVAHVVRFRFAARLVFILWRLRCGFRKLLARRKSVVWSSLDVLIEAGCAIELIQAYMPTFQ